jgi:hypothetical protein
MGARVYLPALRQFLSRDPAGYAVSTDEWAYAPGDPWNFVDPTGWSPERAGNAQQLTRREWRRFARRNRERVDPEGYDRQRSIWATERTLPPTSQEVTTDYFYSHPEQDGIVRAYVRASGATINIRSRRGEDWGRRTVHPLEVRGPENLAQIVGHEEAERLASVAEASLHSSPEVVASELIAALAKVLDHASEIPMAPTTGPERAPTFDESPWFGELAPERSEYFWTADDSATLQYGTGCWSTMRALAIGARELGLEMTLITYQSGSAPIRPRLGAGNHAGFSIVGLAGLWDGDSITDFRAGATPEEVLRTYTEQSFEIDRLIPSSRIVTQTVVR